MLFRSSLKFTATETHAFERHAILPGAKVKALRATSKGRAALVSPPSPVSLATRPHTALRRYRDPKVKARSTPLRNHQITATDPRTRVPGPEGLAGPALVHRLPPRRQPTKPVRDDPRARRPREPPGASRPQPAAPRPRAAPAGRSSCPASLGTRAAPHLSPARPLNPPAPQTSAPGPATQSPSPRDFSPRPVHSPSSSRSSGRRRAVGSRHGRERSWAGSGG